MKKVILSKIEYDFLIESLERLINHTDNSIVDSKWFDRMGDTKRLYELETEYFKIKKYGDPSTNSQMLEWLITKVKNKTLDF